MSAAKVPCSIVKPPMMEGSFDNPKISVSGSDTITAETSVGELSTGTPDAAEMSPLTSTPCCTNKPIVPIEALNYKPQPEEILMTCGGGRPVRLIFGDLPLESWELEGVQQLNDYMKSNDVFTSTVFSDIRYVVRFLQGNDWDVTKCAADIQRHLVWLQEKPACDYDAVREHLNKGWIYVHGRDSGLRPIIFIRCREFSDAKEEEVVPVVLYWLDYILEHLLVKNRVEQWRVVVDLNDCSVTNVPVAILKRVCDVLVRNYRGRLKHMHIINAGFVFRSIWQIISVILPERTKNKITLSSSSYTGELLQSINPGQLEKRFNGSAEDVVRCDEPANPPGPFSVN